MIAESRVSGAIGSRIQPSSKTMGRTQEPGWIVSLAEDSQKKGWGQLKTPKASSKGAMYKRMALIVERRGMSERIIYRGAFQSCILTFIPGTCSGIGCWMVAD